MGLLVSELEASDSGHLRMPQGIIVFRVAEKGSSYAGLLQQPAKLWEINRNHVIGFKFFVFFHVSF